MVDVRVRKQLEGPEGPHSAWSELARALGKVLG